MPFVGLRKSTNERINILQVDDPRGTIDRADLICPACGQPLTVVAGAIVVKHFRHIAKCTSTIDRHPESIQHLIGKWYVGEYCRDLYSRQEITIDYEVPITEANRQADVMVSFSTDFKEAHEIQLASITTESLRDRTRDYRTAGIDVVWWIGLYADTPANRKWCVDTFGDVRVLRFDEDAS